MAVYILKSCNIPIKSTVIVTDSVANLQHYYNTIVIFHYNHNCRISDTTIMIRRLLLKSRKKAILIFSKKLKGAGFLLLLCTLQ